MPVYVQVSWIGSIEVSAQGVQDRGGEWFEHSDYERDFIVQALRPVVILLRRLEAMDPSFAKRTRSFSNPAEAIAWATRWARLLKPDNSEQLRQKAERASISSGYEKVFVAIGRRDGFGCALCGEPSPDLVIDHVVRLCDGGSSNLQNLQLLCESCHDLKTASERGIDPDFWQRAWR